MTLVGRNLTIAVAYWVAAAATMVLGFVLSLPLAVGNVLSLLLHVVTLVTLVWVNRSTLSKIENAPLRRFATFLLNVGLLFGFFGVLYAVSVPLLYALGVVD